MYDIAEFLRRYDPFDGLDEEQLERLAQRVEIEYFAAGTTIFPQGTRPQTKVRVVRRGAVALVDRGRVVDVLGEGEAVRASLDALRAANRIRGARPRGRSLLCALR